MNIKEFQNALTFLQQYYANRKSQDRQFSYEVWAQELSLKSRSYLRLVIVGQRPINEALVQAFTNFFKFTDEEAEYFSVLVEYTQCRKIEQRRTLGLKLVSLNPRSQDRIEAEQHFEFLSDILLPRLQTICGFEDSPMDKKVLAKICGIEVDSLNEKLRKLENLGLMQDQKPVKRHWKVPASGHALGHKEFYKASLKEAEKAIELPFDERKFRGLMVAMNSEEFTDFQKDFEAFAKEQLQKRGGSQLKGRRLYQLNFNFFPVSNAFEEEKV